MAFERKNYEIQVTSTGTTVDLVPTIGATAGTKLVISRVRATVTSDDQAKIYIFKIPNGGTESLATAITYGIKVRKGNPYDEGTIILEEGEGLAVGIRGTGSPAVTFTAYAELETP